MGDIKLFEQAGDKLKEISGETYPIEKTLQSLIEKNLEVLFGLRFLATEYSTGKTHGGRIDTLAIDENSSPVIIEYKRAVNENVVIQGIYYLDWLMEHKADYQMLVVNRLGQDELEMIDWSTARLLCIASQFSKYDEHAVNQIDRNIELIRYKKFGQEMIMLELVNTSTSSEMETSRTQISRKSYRGDASFAYRFSKLSKEQLDWFETLRDYIKALGDDVQEKQLKLYIAFTRISNFACVEVLPQAQKIVIYLKLPPDSIELENGFTRNVKDIGHYGTGDLEITVDSKDDLAKTFPMNSQAYELN